MKISTALSQTTLLLLSSLSFSASDNGRAGVKIHDIRLNFHDDGSRISEIFDRDLQQVPCNEVLGLYSVEEVKQIVAGTFAQHAARATANGIDLPEATSIITEMVPLLEHDIQVMKVCGSCESEGLSGYGCGETDYGYETTHSGLLLLPVNIDSESGSIKIIDTDKLQTWFQFRAITVVQFDNYLSVYQYGAYNVEYQMIAASMGLASISPEKTGYGESHGLVPSSLDKKAITTALLPLLQKARSIVALQSGGMTSIGDEAYFMGYSEGGYSSLAAADGLSQHGITPVKVLSGGAPLKTRSATSIPVIDAYTKGLLDIFQIMNLALVVLPVSGTRPGLANFGSGQVLLEPTLVEDFQKLYMDLECPSFFTSESKGQDTFEYIFTTYPAIGTAYLTQQSIINPNFVAFVSTAIEAGENDPCANSPQLALDLGVDKICEALDDNDLTNVVLDAPYDIEFCHSADDEFIVIDNVPDMSLLKYKLDSLKHGDASLYCAVKMFQGTALEKPIIGQTEAPKPTEAPTQPESPTPTEAPTQPEAPEITAAPKATKAPKQAKGIKKKTKAPKSMKSPKKAKKAPKTL